MSAVIALVSGVLFGFGLLLSGMNDPQKVRAFLDIFGEWRPELMAVMGSAVIIFFIAHRLSIKCRKPFWGDVFHTPALQEIDLRLLLGAVFFGVGWGLVGLCPGPALINILSFDASVIWFILALIAGNRLAHWFVGPVR